MHCVLLIQLPVPQLSFGRKTGNIPLAAACLCQAAAHLPEVRIDILPQRAASYSGDAALLDFILTQRPDTIGFTTYMWNVMRVLYLSREIKRRYNPRIIVGGPEVTPDNLLLQDPAIDFRVFGEGETLFVRLLEEPDLWLRRSGQSAFDSSFVSLPAPYLTTPLDPGIENTMLLETMRGCPYACAYCYYNKSRRRPVFKQEGRVLEALAWALDRGIPEIYFLDPSLNARPGLKQLLKRMAAVNANHKLSLISEIRADHIDMETADLLAAAGFTQFEIGLQSTNPNALARMHRSGDLYRFVQGVTALRQRQIKTVIDLIVGLPGDDPAGFDRTVQFVADHQMSGDIQVFPLSVLPGTEFRRRRQEFGLTHQEMPPYTVISTPAFSQNQILAALEHAEKRFDVSLHPMPDIDLAWQAGAGTAIENAPDMAVALHTCHHVLCKVVVRADRTAADLAAAARRVSHPYQLVFPPGTSKEHWCRALSIFSSANPQTPLEAVFFAPRQLPDVHQFLAVIRLARPHYLDGYVRWSHAQTGNRAVMFTVLTSHMHRPFAGPLQRHVCWWRGSCLPERKNLDHLERQGFDGILIDTDAAGDNLRKWQDQMASLADDLLLIGFARTELHQRWLETTAPDA